MPVVEIFMFKDNSLGNLPYRSIDAVHSEGQHLEGELSLVGGCRRVAATCTRARIFTERLRNPDRRLSSCHVWQAAPSTSTVTTLRLSLSALHARWSDLTNEALGRILASFRLACLACQDTFSRLPSVLSRVISAKYMIFAGDRHSPSNNWYRRFLTYYFTPRLPGTEDQISGNTKLVLASG